MRKILVLILLILCIIFIYKYIDKSKMIGVIYESLPPKEAALLAGMIVGEKSGFDNNYFLNLRNSGVVHIIVVSGTNIVILAEAVIESLAQLIGRKKSIIFGMIIIWGYVLMVGLEAPAVRAVLLISILYWAQALGRKYSLKRSLLLTILIMVAADYRIVLGLSFWLSFTAFLAMVLKPKVDGFLKESVVTTVWICLWVTPILALTVGNISIIAVITNVLILGLVEVVTVYGGLAVFLGSIFSSFGKIMLLFMLPLLKYFVVITESLGELPFSSIDIKFNIWIAVGWYLLIIYVLLRRRNEA